MSKPTSFLPPSLPNARCGPAIFCSVACSKRKRLLSNALISEPRAFSIFVMSDSKIFSTSLPTSFSVIFSTSLSTTFSTAFTSSPKVSKSAMLVTLTSSGALHELSVITILFQSTFTFSAAAFMRGINSGRNVGSVAYTTAPPYPSHASFVPR